MTLETPSCNSNGNGLKMERSRIILPTEFDTAPFCNPRDRGLLYVYYFKVVGHEDVSLEMLRRLPGVFGLARGQRLVFGMV